MSKLRIAFAGTPGLAAHILKQLISSPHKIVTVYTQPDRPAGRGKKTRPSAVKNLALQYDLHVLQPEKAVDMGQGGLLESVDVMVVVAFGLILPEAVLRQPKYGCINVHTSLLPRWRGAAPIQRAILAGDEETGITIMQMDAGLDTGPVLAQEKCPILSGDTTESLTSKLAELGSACLLEVLENIAEGKQKPKPQNDAAATYADKITKPEAEIQWNKPAREIERMIRAFNPAPVAYTELKDLRLRIWQAELLDQETQEAPGTILSCNKTGMDIATGEKIIRITHLQPPGKRIQNIQDFLNGRPDFVKTIQQQ